MAEDTWNWDARIQTCNKQAQHLMDSAEKAETQVARAELLKVAGERIKLAAYIAAHLKV